MQSRREEYQGHVIELRAPRDAGIAPDDVEKPELLIDDVPVSYDQLPDGSYALHRYAYDWTDDLFVLAQRFINHENRTRDNKPID